MPRVKRPGRHRPVGLSDVRGVRPLALEDVPGLPRGRVPRRRDVLVYVCSNSKSERIFQLLILSKFMLTFQKPFSENSTSIAAKSHEI